MKMKPNFSAFRIALLVVLTAGVMTSCGKSDLLTVGDVKNAVKEILEPHGKYYAPAVIQTGFYELNNENARTGRYRTDRWFRPVFVFPMLR